MADLSSSRTLCGRLHPTSTDMARATAAVGRLEAIQAKFSLACTYCAMAETNIDSSRFDEARRLLHSSRRIGTYARRHLQTPNYVPADLLAGIQDKWAQLQSRLASVALRLTKSERLAGTISKRRGDDQTEIIARTDLLRRAA